MLTVDFERLGLEPGACVLDVGCGGGRHLRETRRIAGVTSIGIPIGLGLILLAIALTGLYVAYANRHHDAQMAAILNDAMAQGRGA